MTSTSTFQGMDTSSKPSSRVLAPPGGGSSNIFGTQSPVKQAPPKETAPVQPTQPQTTPAQVSTERSIKQAPKQAYNPITGQPYDLPKAKAASAASTEDDPEETVEDKDEGKENVTSTEVKSVPAPAAEAVKPSTRVAQPPGGKSSGPLW